MELIDYLRIFVEGDGSDLYLSTGAKPSCKFHGDMSVIDDGVLTPGRVEAIAQDIMDELQAEAFQAKPEMNLALSIPKLGRFRVNIFRQRGEVAMVVRAIKTDIPDMKSLGLPEILGKLVMQKRGIVLFVGGTGSGKSTSLASLIDFRNTRSAGHIITIEDPVEFVHRHKKSIVNQREVGTDTDSYDDALENALRQAPDVILIGEIRTKEAMEHALAFAETGHLCLSTLHANNANQAMDRIINFFPQNQHHQILLDLSLNLRGIVSQRLIPTVDRKRAAAIEVLLGTPRVADLIKKGDIHSLKEAMQKGENQGMRTFDSALLELWENGRITAEEALKNADSANNLRIQMTMYSKGVTGSAPPTDKKAAPPSPSPKPTRNAKPAAGTPSANPTSPQPPKATSLGTLSLEPLGEDNADPEEGANSG